MLHTVRCGQKGQLSLNDREAHFNALKAEYPWEHRPHLLLNFFCTDQYCKCSRCFLHWTLTLSHISPHTECGSQVLWTQTGRQVSVGSLQLQKVSLDCITDLTSLCIARKRVRIRLPCLLSSTHHYIAGTLISKSLTGQSSASLGNSVTNSSSTGWVPVLAGKVTVSLSILLKELCKASQKTWVTALEHWPQVGERRGRRVNGGSGGFCPPIRA